MGRRLESVYDDGCSRPGRARFIDECFRREGLTAGGNPVVNEQDPISGLNEVPAEAEQQMTIAVVRRGRAHSDRVTVSCPAWVLAEFYKTDLKVSRHQ